MNDFVLDKHSDSGFETSRAQMTSDSYYRVHRLQINYKRDPHLKHSISKYMVPLVGQGD